MDNQNKFAEQLLKADGIDPANITEAERAAFRDMLDSEKKRMNRLSWLPIGAMWIFAIALLGLCMSERILEKMHIPFVVGALVIAAAMLFVTFRYTLPRNKLIAESNKKISKLHYLVHGRHRGIAMISKKNGKRVIHWLRIFILTSVFWMFISLSGAGVYYLLCQRWIYSNSPMGYIFFNTLMTLSFVIPMLVQGLKAPLEELVELEGKPKKSKPATRYDIWIIFIKSNITKYAAAAVIIIGVLTGIYKLTGSIDGASVAWADVVETFGSMSFYNAVLYAKTDAASEPIQVELWVSNEHKARLRIDSQVLFAENGEVTAGFNFKDKKRLNENEFNQTGRDIITLLSQRKMNSLQDIVQMIHEGQIVETTPKINSDAIISQDLLVFDYDPATGNEWMRIWILRESKLPIRLRSWNPDDGNCKDVFFTYEKQQPDDFFDHKKYEEILMQSDLTTAKERANLAYALLKDPGGKEYVPQHVFEKSQYHMPIVDEIGITKYGAVWLVTSKSENRRKEGRRYDGFSSVNDNSGRYYRRIFGSYSSFTDKGVYLYISEDYPFDERVPESLKLTCTFQRKDGEAPTDYVGSIEITEWTQSSELPQEIKDKENGILIETAYDFSKKKDFDNVQKIVRIIEDSEQSEAYSYKLKQLKLDTLIQQKKFNEASILAKQLWSVEMDIYNKGSWPEPRFLIQYILAVAGNGEIEKAAEWYQELEQAEPDLSIFEENRRKIELLAIRMSRINQTLYDFFSIAGLSLDQVNQIFGFDISENEETKWHVPEKYRK